MVDEQDIPLAGRSLAEGSPADSLADVEKRHITTILTDSNWNLSEAAERLGIHRNTLRLKIKSYGIKKEAK